VNRASRLERKLQQAEDLAHEVLIEVPDAEEPEEMGEAERDRIERAL